MTILSRRNALKGFGTVALALPAIASIPSLVFAQSSPDEYVMRTLEGGLFSLETSKLALRMSSNEVITGFADLEIGEVEAVTAVLTSTGAMPPSDVGAEKKALMEKLMGLEGTEFDTAYIDGQLMAHQELLAIQEPMADMTEITIPVVTAKLARESIKTHIAMLEGIQRMM